MQKRNNIIEQSYNIPADFSVFVSFVNPGHGRKMPVCAIDRVVRNFTNLFKHFTCKIVVEILWSIDKTVKIKVKK